MSTGHKICRSFVNASVPIAHNDRRFYAAKQFVNSQRPHDHSHPRRPAGQTEVGSAATAVFLKREALGRNKLGGLIRYPWLRPRVFHAKHNTPHPSPHLTFLPHIPPPTSITNIPPH